LLPYQGPDLPVLVHCFCRIEPMLERVLISLRCARSRRAAMHPTASLALHRWRSAWLTRASLGTAARAGQHWAGIARVIAGHFFGLRFAETAVRAGFPTLVIEGLCASNSACPVTA